jgi:molybdate transport system substrate-binding protein
VKRVLAGAVAAVLLSGAVVGCSDDGKTTLTVFAASSLTGTFTTLARQFERTHSNVDVVVSFGSSTTLAEQTTAGAPADVIATADETSINQVERAGQLAGSPRRFATNTLVIAVPPGNPGRVSGVQSLNRVDFVACDPSAPCGAAATTMLANAGVTAQPKTFEPDVASTLATVETGEVDAGIVYVTDAQDAGAKVVAVQIPASDNVTNPYFIASVKDSSQSSLADEWVALVTGRAGQRVLHQAGFGKP